VTLPGWGQWTGVQKKKGLPAWIVKEQKDNEKKRSQAMAKRQDAGRKHVIISEKWDKKVRGLGFCSLQRQRARRT
jgi:U3 small nucleolar RNA-associated protein 14